MKTNIIDEVENCFCSLNTDAKIIKTLAQYLHNEIEEEYDAYDCSIGNISILLERLTKNLYNEIKETEEKILNLCEKVD
ncbi:hypothetical protein IKJ53_01175 [bacterium]|nr:hypothetical protein [bacterium]